MSLTSQFGCPGESFEAVVTSLLCWITCMGTTCKRGRCHVITLQQVAKERDEHFKPKTLYHGTMIERAPVAALLMREINDHSTFCILSLPCQVSSLGPPPRKSVLCLKGANVSFKARMQCVPLDAAGIDSFIYHRHMVQGGDNLPSPGLTSRYNYARNFPECLKITKYNTWRDCRGG